MTELMTVHRAALEQWRKAMNLVGPGDVSEHYVDAERALAGLSPRGRWVDLGTGAGFPGVILAALFPHLEVDLVDSRRKRCVFLEHVLGAAPDGDRDRVRVLCRRVETLPEHAYDGVTARAFAPPPQVLEHAARLLKPHGVVILFLQDDTPVPSDSRFRVIAERPYRVAGRQRRSVELALVG